MVNIFFILNVIASVFACRMVRFGVGVGNHERRILSGSSSEGKTAENNECL